MHYVMQVNAMYIQDSYYIQSAKCLILETRNVVTVFWWNMITSFYDAYYDAISLMHYVMQVALYLI